MTNIDLGFGFLAGILSFVSPEALLLFPLLLGAIGAQGRLGMMALALGLGLSLVLGGVAAVLFAGSSGLDATWLRRIVCVLLLAQGIVLLNDRLVERLSVLTGGTGGFGQSLSMGILGGALRQFLLALFVGANWFPRVGPSLGKASMMAASGQNHGLAIGVLFGFGVGASLPWIVMGRVFQKFSGLGAGGAFGGMAGKRMLGMTLLVVAGLGISGFDAKLIKLLDPSWPAWARSITVRF